MIDLEFHPVTPDRWVDLSGFFGSHGNPNYCWCMRWRLRSGEFGKLDAGDRKKMLEESICENQKPVGVLAYHQGSPVGWCSIAPRETFQGLEHSRILKRIDDQPTWSVTCFFVDPDLRGQNLSTRLLEAAVDYAISKGARIIEGYPVEPGQSYRFMGSPGIFERNGFHVAAIAKNGRRIYRYSSGEHGQKLSDESSPGESIA